MMAISHNMKHNLHGFDDETIMSANTSSTFKFTPKHIFSMKNNPLCGVTLGSWMKILLKFGRNIECQYYPRTLFITFLSVFNTFLSWVEWILFESKINATEIPLDPVFVIGHPRTGTTLLQNLLASDFNNFYICTTFCAGFPSSFLWFESIGKVLFASVIEKTRPMDSMPLHFDLPQEDELATNMFSGGISYYMPLWFMSQEPQFRRYCAFDLHEGATADDEREWTESFLYLIRKLTLRAAIESERSGLGLGKGRKRRRLLLKSPVHTARVPLLRKLFPRATFIYVHRDPVEVLQSAVHMADTAYWFCYLNTPSDEQVSNFIFWQFDYLWRKYDEAVAVTPSTPQYEDGKHSQTAMKGSACSARVVASDVMEVAYTDLVGDPLALVEAIYGHCGMEWDPHTAAAYRKQVRALEGYRRNALRPLNDGIRAAVRERWQGYCAAFGYHV